MKKNKHTIQTDLGNLEYSLKKSYRAKNIRISIDSDGEILVTLPYIARKFLAEKFLFEKAEWIFKKLEKIKSYSRIKISDSRGDYLKNKEIARNIVLAKVKYYNRFYGFKFSKIFIKNQKTIWGSCSQKGNLNFNYKVIYLPEKLIDYVIVHELCHLKELNHSKSFWKLVEKEIPDYREIRKELRNKRIN